MKPAPYRVLHLIGGPEWRGAELFAARLAGRLHGRGFESSLCSLYPPSGRPEAELPWEVQMFSLHGRPGSLGTLAGVNLPMARKLQAVLRDLQPQYLIAHGGDTLKYAALTRLFRRETRIIYKNIGTASFWANSIARATLTRLLLRGVDAVVSVSQYTQQDFIRHYRLPPERVTSIPNGVDTSEYRQSDLERHRSDVRQALGLAPSDIAFITVGSLSPEKGLGEFLELMADMTGMGFRDRLLLVGSGPLRQELERKAKQLDIAHRVHFMGTRNDVPRFLAAADLFVLPSKTEGMPAVLIEAGMAGLASVAFNVGAVAEVVQHGATGLLAPPGDYRNLLEALVALRQDPERRQGMGAAARQRCYELFDMNKVAQEYRKLFATLLDGRAGAVQRVQTS